MTITRVQDRHLALARDALGEHAFQLAVEAGRAMPLERAIDMALGPNPPSVKGERRSAV